MAIDFEEQFGINAGYVESLYESWREDAGSVDPQWASYFASADATSAPPRAGASAPPPRESDEDFEATMQLVRDVNYAVAYSFKYSQRPGTPAAEMFGQVPEDVKDVRLQALQKLLRDQQTEFNESKIGQTVPVLVTGRGRLEGQAHGRSPWMQSVHFQGPEELTGQIVDVKVSGATMSSLTGDLVREHEVAL